jgi:hypothetical protein
MDPQLVQENTMKTSKWLVVVFLVLSLGPLFGQSKPNFSGEWTMVPAKSDFGMIPAPTSAVQKITHNDPDLKVVNTQTGDQGTSTIESNYTTDGKESVNKGRMGGDVKSTAKWDGSTLVIESRIDIEGNVLNITNKLTLSEDGKTLTGNLHFAGAMGEGDAKIVYEKK